MAKFEMEKRAPASLRLLPDFLIIGAAKSGTTSLYHYLVAHPRIARARRKEVQFFYRKYGQGPSWYRAHFPLTLYRAWKTLLHGEFATGEASPAYLFYPHAPRRAHALVPRAKLIAILRNPIDRAYSHYRHELRKGTESLSFEEALEKEPERTAREWERVLADETYRSLPLFDYSYARRGLYAEQLERWLEHYPRESLLAIRAEDLFSDPLRSLHQVTDFLGLSRGSASDYGCVFERHNADPEPAVMRPQTRTRLEELFAPANRRLYTLLGCDFGWPA